MTNARVQPPGKFSYESALDSGNPFAIQRFVHPPDFL
jgi:hypothetical protein